MLELTEQEVLARLRRQVEQRGSQKAWADAAGVTPQYIHDVLRGRRGIGAPVLAALGVERIVRYVAVDAGGRT
ncbi:transcriptional regulator [Methylobacterium sp. SD21]|uniref:transcriptional regulator n=1 Tax=Methylobacterium litchii TaxID=3138810 RepID=UPI00313C15D5